MSNARRMTTEAGPTIARAAGEGRSLASKPVSGPESRPSTLYCVSVDRQTSTDIENAGLVLFIPQTAPAETEISCAYSLAQRLGTNKGSIDGPRRPTKFCRDCLIAR